MRPSGPASAAMSSPWYRRVITPATVPDAYPPRPLVTSHSFVASASGSSGATTGQGIRRRVSMGIDSLSGSPAPDGGPRSAIAAVLRRKHDCALAWNAPPAPRPDVGCSASAVRGLLARPSELPLAAVAGGEQRLGKRSARQVAPEIHDEEAIVGMVVGEEPEREGCPRQDGAVQRAGRPLPAKRGIFAAQPDQIAVQRVCGRMPLALGKIQFASL